MLKLNTLYTVCFHGIILDIFDDTIRTIWPGKISAGLLIRHVLSEFSSVAESIFHVNLKCLDVQRQEVMCSFLMSVFFITTK